MITIDGSHGEGGGQILRTSLALALVTGRALRIEKIRAGRQKPGLRRQHLTAVNAAVKIGRANVAGNTLGSQKLAFAPAGVYPGTYCFAVGTAGSCTLVLQTVLPALMTADHPSALVLEGGTHNPFAPSFDFLKYAFLPLINRMGPTVEVRLQRPGFYPAGGGKIRVDITPAPRLVPLELLERGALIGQSAKAMVSRLPVHIARRELKVVRKNLGWSEADCHTEQVTNSPGAGNVLTLRLCYDNLSEVFTGFGRKGMPAEKVAVHTARAVQAYLDAQAPVGPFLADQLLIPMALAGSGAFRTSRPRRHTTTNADIIQEFLSGIIQIRQIGAKHWEIGVK